MQGSKGEGMFAIRKGTLTIRDDENLIIATLHAGQIFGDQFLIRYANSPVNVVADGDVEVLLLRRSDFLTVVYSMDDDVLGGVMKKVSSLKGAPFFNELSYPQQVKIANSSITGSFPRGSDIVRCGSFAAYVVIAHSGVIEAQRPIRALNDEAPKAHLFKSTSGSDKSLESVALVQAPCILCADSVEGDHLSAVTLKAKVNVECILITPDVFLKVVPSSIRKKWVEFNIQQCSRWIQTEITRPKKKLQRFERSNAFPLSPLKFSKTEKKGSSIRPPDHGISSAFCDAKGHTYMHGQVNSVRDGNKIGRKTKEETENAQIDRVFGGNRRSSIHQQRAALKDLATSQCVDNIRQMASEKAEKKLKQESERPVLFEQLSQSMHSDHGQRKRPSNTKRETKDHEHAAPYLRKAQKHTGFDAQYGQDPTLNMESRRRLKVLLEKTAEAGLNIPPSVYEDPKETKGDNSVFNEIRQSSEELQKLLSDSENKSTPEIRVKPSHQRDVQKLIQQLENALDKIGIKRPTSSTAQQTLAPVGSSFLEHLRYRSALQQPVGPWKKISKFNQGSRATCITPDAQKSYEYNVRMHRTTASKLSVARRTLSENNDIDSADPHTPGQKFGVKKDDTGNQNINDQLYSPLRVRKKKKDKAPWKRPKAQTNGDTIWQSSRQSSRQSGARTAEQDNHQPYSNEEAQEAEQRYKEDNIGYEDVLHVALEDDMTNNEFIGSNQYQKAATLVAAHAARGQFSSLEEALSVQKELERGDHRHVNDLLRPSKHFNLIQDDDFRGDVVTPNTKRRRQKLNASKSSLQRLFPPQKQRWLKGED